MFTEETPSEETTNNTEVHLLETKKSKKKSAFPAPGTAALTRWFATAKKSKPGETFESLWEKRAAAARKANPLPVMTYRTAMAAGEDAANRQMRKAGRTKWSRADYNIAARTFNRLYPVGSERNPFEVADAQGNYVGGPYAKKRQAQKQQNLPSVLSMSVLQLTMCIGVILVILLLELGKK